MSQNSNEEQSTQPETMQPETMQPETMQPEPMESGKGEKNEEKAKENPKKRKRGHVTKTQPSPLELLASETPASAFAMKKLINGAGTPVPKEAKAILKTITGHSSDISEEDMSVIADLYRSILEQKAKTYMAECLRYYEEHHGFDLKKKDDTLVERALERPKRVSLDAIKGVYDHYLCNLEERHKYYSRHLRGQQPVKKTKRERKSNDSKPAKFLPYNLFIKESWQARKAEFNAIAKESGISSVMKLLSSEWKGNEELKNTYREKADEMNKGNTADAQQPVVETAV